MSTIGITLITNSSSDPDVDAYLNATRLSNTQYYATKRNAVSTLVSSLKEASIWDSIVCIYPFVETNINYSKNLKDPTLYPISMVSSPPDIAGYYYNSKGLNCLGSPNYASIPTLNVRFDTSGNIGAFMFTSTTSTGGVSTEKHFFGAQQDGVLCGFSRDYDNTGRIGHGMHGNAVTYQAMAGYHMVARDSGTVHSYRTTTNSQYTNTFTLTGSNDVGVLTNSYNLTTNTASAAADLGLAGIFTNSTPINYADLRTISLTFLTTMGRY